MMAMGGEWFDAYVTPPPEDGSWVIAVNNDASGLDFLQFRDGEWINGSGEGSLFENENFGLHHSVWTHAPKWLRIYCDTQECDAKFEKWREGLR